MNKPMMTPINSQHANGSQSQKRAWVTPTFEQMPLKDALAGSGPSLPDDIGTSSS